MNAVTLARLAEENNPTLITLVKRWMNQGGYADPVPDAIQMKKYHDAKKRRNWFAFLCFVAVTGMMLAVFIFCKKSIPANSIYSYYSPGEELTATIVLPLLFGLVGVWWQMMIGTKIADRHKFSIQNVENLNSFCHYITLIEAYSGAYFLPKDEWTWFTADERNKGVWVGAENLYNAGNVVANMLRDRAAKIVQLQQIPWRQEEALHLREKLITDWSCLSRLLNILKTEGDLFRPDVPQAVRISVIPQH